MQLPRPVSPLRGVSSGWAIRATQSFQLFLESQLLKFHAGEGIAVRFRSLVLRAYARIQVGVTGFQAFDAGLQAHIASLARSFATLPSEHAVEWQRKRNAFAADCAIPIFPPCDDILFRQGSKC